LKIQVPNIREAIPPKAAVSKSMRSLGVLIGAGRMVGEYPSTSGSQRDPYH
jgi:hypothetical protein